MRSRHKILDHFENWSCSIKTLDDEGSCREYFKQELPGLLKDKELFKPLLKAIVGREKYPDVMHPTMFDSEIIIYRDPDWRFSIRLYLWGPGEYDPIHDHNSWGVIGTALGTLDIINYQRLDDEKDDRYAILEETSRQFIPTGDTYSIYPLNYGIHKTGNANNPAIIQVGIYGANLTGRCYVNVFDTMSGEISRLYLPHVKKRNLAVRALDNL